MVKELYFVFSALLLIYLVLPGPTSIDDFPAVPDSIKSNLPGDTYQVSNTAGFYSDKFRDFVTNYYQNEYKKLTWIPFPPIRLNYPPEVSFDVIKKHTDSTYLEEFVYPLRDSLYVNGFEPYYEDGEPRFENAAPVEYDRKQYPTKVTIRYYSSPIWVRLITWIGININVLLIYLLGKRVLLHD